MKSANNKVAEENQLPGTGDWKLQRPAINREIEGYASLTSVMQGEAIELYVHSKAPEYMFRIYRMGWYGGKGAREMLGPIEQKATQQAMPSPDPKTGHIVCNWRNPYSLHIKEDWPSGVYIVKLQEQQQLKESYIIFVVKDKGNQGDILFQLPVTTYQAYNFWGGKSLYEWGSGSLEKWGKVTGKAATHVSFDRPYTASNNPKAAYGTGAGEFFTNIQPVTTHFYPISSAAWDYNMVRWLEKNGYNVDYCTNLDTHSDPSLLLRHQLFISHGHDEYWSANMRKNMEYARDSGINLAFFAGNTGFWQIRLEDAENNSSEPRTMVCYKNLDDPIYGSETTVNFRDRPVNRPESSLLGVQHFMDPVDTDIVISEPEHWIFKGTGLKKGDKLKGVLGYEIDTVTEHSPKNLEILGDSPAINRINDNYWYTVRQLVQKVCRKLGIGESWIFNKVKPLFVLLFLILMLGNVFLSYFLRTTTYSLFLVTQLVFIAFVFWMVHKIVMRNNKKIVQRGNSQMTFYVARSGAGVFANGTIQWSWGLDDFNASLLRSSRKSKQVEIITKNVLDTLSKTKNNTVTFNEDAK